MSLVRSLGARTAWVALALSLGLACNVGAAAPAAARPLAAAGDLLVTGAKPDRLFVIDAGLEMSALRAKYPNTSQYAVVRGQVRPRELDSKHRERLSGVVSDLDIDEINVPFAFRGALKRVFTTERADELNKSPFEAKVAYGKRLEPWINSVEKK